jgi:hypothetical protein
VELVVRDRILDLEASVTVMQPVSWEAIAARTRAGFVGSWPIVKAPNKTEVRSPLSMCVPSNRRARYGLGTGI